VSFLQELRTAQADLVQRNADPFRERAEAAVRGKGAISTAALLDLLDLPKTTGSARRIAKTMRSLGFVPIKSRRLMPGGFRDTIARGWARPVLEPKRGREQGEKVKSLELSTRRTLEQQQKGLSHVSRS
jgi:hypothetical protein